MFISVGTKPRIVTPLQALSATSPNSATFKCEVDPGDPLPTVQWFKGGREIRASRKYAVTYANRTATLVVKETTVDDDAVYMCSVDNRVGRVDTEAQLTVNGKTLKPYMYIISCIAY